MIGRICSFLSTTHRLKNWQKQVARKTIGIVPSTLAYRLMISSDNLITSWRYTPAGASSAFKAYFRLKLPSLQQGSKIACPPREGWWCYDLQPRATSLRGFWWLHTSVPSLETMENHWSMRWTCSLGSMASMVAQALFVLEADRRRTDPACGEASLGFQKPIGSRLCCSRSCTRADSLTLMDRLRSVSSIKAQNTGLLVDK